MTTEKVFTGIETDYSFFMSHSTEAASVLDCLCSESFRSVINQSNTILDFGGGDGEFTENVFKKINLSPKMVMLVEPAASYHEKWIERLRGMSQCLSTQTSIDTVNDKSVELIIANHVLYYVGDLSRVIEEHKRISKADAFAIYSMASVNNSLIKMWDIGFEAGLDMNTPYNSAPALEAVLRLKEISCEPHLVHSEFVCLDTKENRTKLLRFLFKDHLSKFKSEGKISLDAFLNKHSLDGKLKLPLEDWVYLVNMGDK